MDRLAPAVSALAVIESAFSLLARFAEILPPEPGAEAHGGVRRHGCLQLATTDNP